MTIERKLKPHTDDSYLLPLTVIIYKATLYPQISADCYKYCMSDLSITYALCLFVC